MMLTVAFFIVDPIVCFPYTWFNYAPMSQTRLKSILTPSAHLQERFVPDYRELSEIVEQLKKMGYKIVLTEGVYDLIHEGHALYLEKSRSHGDILIVGVDSDELTRKRKGPDRPIVPQNERINMLIHLRHVDIVTIKEAAHEKERLINLIKPDVLIVSETTKDFSPEEKAAYRSVCGDVVILPAQATTSTTARIRNLTIEGANKLAGEISRLTSEFVEKIKKG
jgi:D-beta-D-heptose 7-phosphate kinase/D-beta-D-heptose 1-phosphate adenosyltransferase